MGACPRLKVTAMGHVAILAEARKTRDKYLPRTPRLRVSSVAQAGRVTVLILSLPKDGWRARLYATRKRRQYLRPSTSSGCGFCCANNNRASSAWTKGP